MNCPACQHEEHETIDSRSSGQMIRRRRKCRKCENRWSTYECNAEFLEGLMAPRTDDNKLRGEIEHFLARMDAMIHPQEKTTRFRLA